jgi:hypothetical protein
MPVNKKNPAKLNCFFALIASGALTACVTSGATTNTPASQPAATQAPAVQQAAEPPAPLLSAEEALIKVKTDCWMQLETDRKAPRDLDKRSALVNKCVAEKTRALR